MQRYLFTFSASDVSKCLGFSAAAFSKPLYLRSLGVVVQKISHWSFKHLTLPFSMLNSMRIESFSFLSSTTACRWRSICLSCMINLSTLSAASLLAFVKENSILWLATALFTFRIAVSIATISVDLLPAFAGRPPWHCFPLLFTVWEKKKKMCEDAIRMMLMISWIVDWRRNVLRWEMFVYKWPRGSGKSAWVYWTLR